MKTKNYLLLLFIFLIAISSCTLHDDLMTMKDNESTATKDLSVELPTPESHLFADVDQSIKDSVLLKLQKDIQEESQYPPRFANRKNLRSQTSEIRFAPVVRLYSYFESMQKDIPRFKKLEDLAYFYEMENGKLLSLYSAKYKDNSDFTKDSNPEMYQAFVELFGQEYTDKSVELTRNTKGADRWRIDPFSDIFFQLFEYALSQADDGKVIILKQRYMPIISYFKDNKFLYCKKARPGEDIYVGSVEELVG